MAFIEHDQTASPGWLAALIETRQSSDADIGPGSAQAVYDHATPASGPAIRAHPVTEPGAAIRAGSTCNLLPKGARPQSSAPRRFIEALGRSGGEDTVFLLDLLKAGARLAFSSSDPAFENFPQHRQSMAYVISLVFRMGTHP